jgi:hypothetical protein
MSTPTNGKSDKKSEKNTYATKQATGSLFRAVSLSTDPGQLLMFSSSMINTTRAGLIQKLEDRVPDYDILPSIFTAILRTMVIELEDKGMLSKDGAMVLDEQFDKVFKSESMARYGLELYRDIRFCDAARIRWKVASDTYIQDHDAWAISNNILSEIHSQMFEIIVRHDLMQFPRGELFSIDEQGINISKIAKAMQEAGGA